MAPRYISRTFRALLVCAMSWLTLSLFGLQFGFHSRPGSKINVIDDLLDTDLFVETPAYTTPCDQWLGSHRQMWTISAPLEWDAHKPFEITVQCDASIVGTKDCSGFYHILFRGPVSVSLPPGPNRFKHHEASGSTKTSWVLPQAGHYEVWAWRDRLLPEDGECESIMNMGKGSFGRLAARTSLHIKPVAQHPEIDNLRDCTLSDYADSLAGRWVSLTHIRPKYRDLPWLQQMEPNRTSPLGDYVFVLYNCKWPSFSLAAAVDQIGDLTHAAWIGDSILRTSVCGHVAPALVGDRIGDTPCAFSEDESYHSTDKDFARRTRDGRAVTFSHRMIDARINERFDVRVENLPSNVSHLIVNIGMWFATVDANEYSRLVNLFLERIWGKFGAGPRIAWLDTPAVVPASTCMEAFTRYYLRQQSFLARDAIARFKLAHPQADIHQVPFFEISDGRPETSPEGRHWAEEGVDRLHYDLTQRPYAGRADWVAIRIIFESWRLAWEASPKAKQQYA